MVALNAPWDPKKQTNIPASSGIFRHHRINWMETIGISNVFSRVFHSVRTRPNHGILRKSKRCFSSEHFILHSKFWSILRTVESWLLMNSSRLRNDEWRKSLCGHAVDIFYKGIRKWFCVILVNPLMLSFSPLAASIHHFSIGGVGRHVNSAWSNCYHHSLADRYAINDI